MTLVLLTWLSTTAACAVLLLVLMGLQRLVHGPAHGGAGRRALPTARHSPAAEARSSLPKDAVHAA